MVTSDAKLQQQRQGRAFALELRRFERTADRVLDPDIFAPDAALKLA